MAKIKERELFKQFNDWVERIIPELKRKFQIVRLIAWGLSIITFLSDMNLFGENWI